MAHREKNIIDLIASAPWREAVKYRETWPHEYAVIQKDGQQELLAEFCRRILRARAFNKLKHWRRIASRYDHRSIHFSMGALLDLRNYLELELVDSSRRFVSRKWHGFRARNLMYPVTWRILKHTRSPKFWLF